MDIKLSDFIWTFGNHEPLSMYRRIGGKSTGGVQGGALWLEDWHHWYDSEACAESMASLGLNILHCRFYKGMGWDFEQKDFPGVRDFARACRKRGIKVLGYVQFSTLYYEIMQREIPNLHDWAARGYHGELLTFLVSYWRWMPCVRHPEFIAYLKKILTIMIDEEVFDGVLFDNVFTMHCYCPNCQSRFKEHIRQCGFDFVDPDFVELPPPASAGNEIMDPIYREMLRFHNRGMADTMAEIYDFIKKRNPEFIVSGNFAINRRESHTVFCSDPLLLGKSFDIILGQSGNEPCVEDGCVISQIPELKMARAINCREVPLNDADAGGTGEAGPAFVCRLFESLFNGVTPVDRTVMKPLRGGGLDLHRLELHRPVLEAVKKIAAEFGELLNAPAYEPVGLLHVNESIMLSQSSYQNFLRAETSLLRGHIPYCRLVGEDWRGCETIIIPGAACLSDKLVRELLNFKGRLILAGEGCGDFDENYCQREENPFIGRNPDKVAITPHEILEEGWRIKIRHHADNWGELFRTAVEVEMPPEGHAEIKMRHGVVAAVLITSPVPLDMIKVRIASHLRAAAYRSRSLEERYEPAPFVDDAITLSCPDGMVMLLLDDHCFNAE